MARMAEPTTSRVYDLWSRCYDGTFGRLVHKRQCAAIEALAPAPGERVLDLGIGTGMALSMYPEGVRLVGMDLSAGMLAKARAKADELARPDTLLIQGDALHPPFAEQSFDHLIVTHTVSVVSDPSRLMRWCARLLKPGGRLVVLNHFQSEHRPIARLEQGLNPLCCRIGWRSDLPLDECLAGSGLIVHEQFKLTRVDLWRIIVLTHGTAE